MARPKQPLVALATLALVTLTAIGADGQARERERARFDWRGSVPRGRTLEIHGVHGDIRAERATGNQVIVSALKTADNRSDPDDVQIEVVEHDDGVLICARYPRPDGTLNECSLEGNHESSGRHHVKVNFRVQVPDGVVLVARTVNGAVAVAELRGRVQATTVNGDVDVVTTDVAEATTVNGTIDVRMGRMGANDLEFTTVNGDINVDVATELNANVVARTMRGGISTDLPLTVKGKMVGRRLNGTVGRGGAELALTTMNGSIRLTSSR